MEVVRTVCGDIPPEKLGFCHSHEHIMLRKGVPYSVDESLCMDDYGKSLAELRLFKSVGGGAIVDCQPVGAGRMSRELAMLSAESGVHIVASTGFHKAQFYEDSHWLFSFSEERLAEIFLHELNIGMFTSTENKFPGEYHNSRAGVIKTAYDIAGLTERYGKLFSAAAAAQSASGAPMLIHIDNGADPLLIDDFLTTKCAKSTKKGVQRRIYSHLDRACADVSVHIELCRRGAYLGYDTIHRLKYHDDDAEIAIIKKVLEAGYGDRILLGMDATNKRLKAYGSDIGLDYIAEVFIPKMERAGIAGAMDFCVQNPARAFSYDN